MLSDDDEQRLIDDIDVMDGLYVATRKVEEKISILHE